MLATFHKEGNGKGQQTIENYEQKEYYQIGKQKTLNNNHHCGNNLKIYRHCITAHSKDKIQYNLLAVRKQICVLLANIETKSRRLFPTPL
jgi:hypothetical protein